MMYFTHLLYPWLSCFFSSNPFWPSLSPIYLPIASATPKHSGRPVPPDAVVRQRAPQCPGTPVGGQHAVRVLWAVQPPGSMPHHHVCHGHAEVSLAPCHTAETAYVVSLGLSALIKGLCSTGLCMPGFTLLNLKINVFLYSHTLTFTYIPLCVSPPDVPWAWPWSRLWSWPGTMASCPAAWCRPWTSCANRYTWEHACLGSLELLLLLLLF